MTKYLHTMIRVSSLEDSIAFFGILGLREIRRRADEKGRYTNVFLAAPGDDAAPLELTYNWDPEPYTGGRNFGHLAYAVDNSGRLLILDGNRVPPTATLVIEVQVAFGTDDATALLESLNKTRAEFDMITTLEGRRLIERHASVKVIES